MLRLGILDFDTSHAVEFTQRFNQVGVDRDQWVDGARVVAGCPGTSQMSPERIAGFTEQVRACGVEIVERPEDLLGRIDGALVLSLSGTMHRQRAVPFLEAGIPTFIDKPCTCALADAQEIDHIAGRHGTPWFSSSAMPFAEETLELCRRADEWGGLCGLFAYGPGHRAAGNPGLFHYGIHVAALIFAAMGAGCLDVAASAADSETAAADVVTGRWRDGRLATLRAARGGATGYGFVAFCGRAVVARTVSSRYAYRNLCRAIVDWMQSGQLPVAHEITIEITRFILASEESRRAGGAPVRLDAIT
jgi:predicted dehydrogenase